MEDNLIGIGFALRTAWQGSEWMPENFEDAHGIPARAPSRLATFEQLAA